MVLGYKHPEQPSASSVILDAELVGVTEAIANLTQRGAEDPHIRLQVGLSDSGIATIYDAFAYGEVKEESIAGKIKNFFGGSSSSTTSTETDTETASESPTSSAENAEPTEVKLKPNAIPLEINYKFLTIPPYSVEEISDARKRLIAVDQAEKVRAKTGEARNMLEGYMYRLRDYLDGDEMTPFMLFSKPEERAKLEAKYNENMAWFHEEGDTADMAALWSRRDEMEYVSLIYFKGSISDILVSGHLRNPSNSAMRSMRQPPRNSKTFKRRYMPAKFSWNPPTRIARLKRLRVFHTSTLRKN